jgi:hypothetical protein
MRVADCTAMQGAWIATAYGLAMTRSVVVVIGVTVNPGDLNHAKFFPDH